MTKDLELARISFMTSEEIENLKVKFGSVIEMKGLMFLQILMLRLCNLNLMPRY